MRVLRESISRLWGALSRVRRDADLEEELRLHLELAAEAARRGGESPEQAARTARLRAGGESQAMEALRDRRGVPWLDSLASDVVFGWRQLNKHRVAAAAAVLSLGLAIGATVAAFRLVDAVLLRPLPVADPDRLFTVATTVHDPEKRPDYQDDFDYPTYREYVKAVGDTADLMVVGMTAQQPVVFAGNGEPEIVFRQFLSGNVFPVFGLRPAAGRLLTPQDDVTPGGHPVAVLSFRYWTRRFARDPAAIGRTFRLGAYQFEIIGVAPEGFTGTEPGSAADLFLPAMMNAQAINSPGWSWFRIWVRPRSGAGPEQIREMLQVRLTAEQQQRAKKFPAETPQELIDAFLAQKVLLLPAGSGASAIQKTFRRPLLILAALAGLVLLIACGNVANLLIGRAMARSREMALRVSIGAARWRLIQLVLIESALLAAAAVAVGVLFASWSAAFVVSMLASVDRPVRLVLETDWRALLFCAALAMSVTILFGSAPALRASSVKPVDALRRGEDPHIRRRLTDTLIAVQTAFCVFLLFTAGLFGATFQRLVSKPLGFSPSNLLIVQVDGRDTHPPEVWTQIADQLRQISGVDEAALAGWAPLTGNRWRGTVRVDGSDVNTDSPYFIDVSPSYFATMHIEMLAGRDFRPDDVQPGKGEPGKPAAGVGIVNAAFSRIFFDGRSPVGSRVSVGGVPMEIVGLVRDVAYYTVREPMHATVYVPLTSRSNGAFMVRTAGDPLALVPALRAGLSRARPDFRVRAVEPQMAFVNQQLVRERLLAMLSTFFAIIALALAGIGVYGVLNYWVVRQRREIGIRMALGARALDVVQRVTGRMMVFVAAGAFVGLAGGLAFGRLVQALLFQVSPTDPASLIVPMIALALCACGAAAPAAIRAVRIDPAQTLRAD